MLYILSNIIVNIHMQNLSSSLSVEFKVSFPLSICNGSQNFCDAFACNKWWVSGNYITNNHDNIEVIRSINYNLLLLYFRWLFENRNLKCARVTYVIKGKNYIKLHPSSCANNEQFDKVLFSISNSDCDRVKSSITMSISIFSWFFFSRYNFDDCFHIDVRALFLFTQNHC